MQTKRSLYGLKQASRCWNRQFTDTLGRFDLKATEADPCVFTSGEGNERLILAIYIDDGLIVSSDEKKIKNVLRELQKKHEVKTNVANMFLGLQIEQKSNGAIFLHQEAYTNRVLVRFRMENANPVTIPADKQHESNDKADASSKEAANAPYQQAIGSLMYLSVATRPDITYAVNKASQYLEKPSKANWNNVKRILKYLKGTTSYGLYFDSRNIFFQLESF